MVEDRNGDGADRPQLRRVFQMPFERVGGRLAAGPVWMYQLGGMAPTDGRRLDRTVAERCLSLRQSLGRVQLSTVQLHTGEAVLLQVLQLLGKRRTGHKPFLT